MKHAGCRMSVFPEQPGNIQLCVGFTGSMALFRCLSPGPSAFLLLSLGPFFGCCPGLGMGLESSLFLFGQIPKLHGLIDKL